MAEKVRNPLGGSGPGLISKSRQDYLRQIKAPGASPAPMRSKWALGTAKPDPTFDDTSVPAGAPLPTNMPTRTQRRTFGVSEGD